MHRYIVRVGRFRGRRWVEMHISDHHDEPICGSWKAASQEEEMIYSGRPEGYALCRDCSRARARFEEQERLRTWQQAE